MIEEITKKEFNIKCDKCGKGHKVIDKLSELDKNWYRVAIGVSLGKNTSILSIHISEDSGRVKVAQFPDLGDLETRVFCSYTCFNDYISNLLPKIKK